MVLDLPKPRITHHFPAMISLSLLYLVQRNVFLRPLCSGFSFAIGSQDSIKQEEVKTICTNRRDDDITLSKMSETHLTVWVRVTKRDV